MVEVMLRGLLFSDIRNASTYRFSSADVEKIIASKQKFNTRPKAGRRDGLSLLSLSNPRPPITILS
jgi:hypothetical protein